MTSKRAIGTLKGHFPWLRAMRKVTTEDTPTLADVSPFIDAAIVLHNSLAKCTDNNDLEEWSEENDKQVSSPDDPNCSPDDDESKEKAHNADVGNLHRSQPMHHSLKREMNMTQSILQFSFHITQLLGVRRHCNDFVARVSCLLHICFERWWLAHAVQPVPFFLPLDFS